jgi:Uma2 family endonuclease
MTSESIARDYGDKFEECEKAGVTECWLADPLPDFFATGQAVQAMLGSAQ